MPAAALALVLLGAFPADSGDPTYVTISGGAGYSHAVLGVQVAIQTGPVGASVAVFPVPAGFGLAGLGLRWMPWHLGGPFVGVNAAAFLATESFFAAGVSLTVGWRHWFSADWYFEVAAGPAAATMGALGGSTTSQLGALGPLAPRWVPDITLAFGRRN